MDAAQPPGSPPSTPEPPPRSPPSTPAPAAYAALSAWRAVVAVLIAFAGSAVVWVTVPYNNFLLNNTYLSDSYLPEIVVAFLLLIVLAVNPLLRVFGPRCMLNRRQIALIGSLMLLAAVIPSNGLMRMFPRLVAEINQGMNENAATAAIAAGAGIRPQLFPDPLPAAMRDGGVQTNPTPISDALLDELDEGASIPWRAWLAPMASWGMLIIGMWAMMLGLGGVVYPQWRERERLPFPLLNVYQALIGESDDDPARTLPAVFSSRLFWIACVSVFLIHASRGLDAFTHSFPAFPLSWNLSSYFTDGLMRHAPPTLKTQAIFFSIAGVAYFIPSRYAISVWFWVYAYAWYTMFGSAYIPAFDAGQVEEQAFGALLAIAVWVLWLGRNHWRQVGAAMFGRAGRSDTSRRDAVAGWMFALGCVSLVLWLHWAGCAFWWCVLAMIGCVLLALLMARIIAETGVPVLWTSRMSVSSLTSFFPLAWQSPAILLFTGVFYALLTRASGVSAAVMCTMGLGMDRKAKPADHSRLLVLGLVLMLVGFIVCGAVHLKMGYRSADEKTQAKTSASVLNQWDRVGRADYHFLTPGRGQQAAGFGVGMGLLWACSRFPAWPIHPVGMVFSRMSIGNLIWFSIFLGWLVRMLITRLFGGGAYRKARPLFLGLVIGELLAVIVWALVPVVIVMVTGADPAEVPRYTLIQYP